MNEEKSDEFPDITFRRHFLIDQTGEVQIVSRVAQESDSQWTIGIQWKSRE